MSVDTCAALVMGKLANGHAVHITSLRPVSVLTLVVSALLLATGFARAQAPASSPLLHGQMLVRLDLDSRKVVCQERMLRALGERIRDVRQGPDGWLYMLTYRRKGRVLRLER